MVYRKNRRYKKASPKFQRRRRKLKKNLGSVRKTGKQTVLHLSKLPNRQMYPDRYFMYCMTPLDVYVSTASTIGSATIYNFIIKANSVFNPYDPHVKLGSSSYNVQRSNGFDAVPALSTSMASATPSGLSAIWNNNVYANATVLSSAFDLQVFDTGDFSLANVAGQTVGSNNSNTWEVGIIPVGNTNQSGYTIGQVATSIWSTYGPQKMRSQPFAVTSVFRPVARNRPLRISCSIPDLFGQPRNTLIEDISRSWMHVPSTDPSQTCYYVVSINSLSVSPFQIGTCLRMNLRHHVMLSGLTATDQD